MCATEDSNEVPNQSENSGSGNGVIGASEVGGEATSSVQGRVSSGHATPGPYARRASATHIPPLNRQQQLLLVCSTK